MLNLLTSPFILRTFCFRRRLTELAETACLVALDDKSMPELYLDYKSACGEEKPLSFSTFRDLKPWNCKKLKPQTCVCIYHRKAALFIRALNVGRAQLHNTCKDIPNAIFKERFPQDCGECQHAGSCKCKCRACKTRCRIFRSLWTR